MTVLTALLLLVVSCVLIVAVTLVALVYTPLAGYVSIPNPELERRYGREIAETQEQLSELNRDVLAVKYYNLQLRRALGDPEARDSSEVSRSILSSVLHARGADSIGRGVKQHQAVAVSAGEAELMRTRDPVSRQGALVTTSAPSSQLRFPLLPPTEGFVSQQFDPSRQHFGIDYAGKPGAPIYAAADGYVVFSGWTYDDGNMLIISHGNRFLTVYKHNQSLLKSAHSLVKRGEVIAVLGTSGRTSLGPHLHFEVWRDGIPDDPEKYMLSDHAIH